MQNNSIENDLQNTSILFEIPNWCRIFLAAYVSGVTVAGLSGNALVVIVQTRLKQKSPTDWFVLALAICDVVSLVVNLPVYFLGFTSLWKFVGTTAGCKLHTFIHFQTYLSSAFFFALIGVDRYTKICRPHSVYFTPTRAKRACVITVLISTVLNFHHFFLSGLDMNGGCVFQKYETDLSCIDQVAGCLIIVTVTVLISSTHALVYKRMRRLRKIVPSALSPNLRSKTTKNKTKIQSVAKVLEERERRPRKTWATFLCTMSQETRNEVQILELGTKVESSSGNRAEGTEKPHVMPSSVAEPKQENNIETTLTNTSTNGNNNRNEDKHRVNLAKNQSGGIKSVSETLSGTISREPRSITTTNTMAVAGILYVICTLVPSIASAIWTNLGGKQTQASTVAFLLLRLLYCVNLFINPYFYISMSSRFRRKTIETVRGVC